MRTDKKTAWFLAMPVVVIAILCAGPLALPLVWMSPAFNKWQRWAISAIMLIFTIWIFRVSAELYGMLLKDMQALQNAMM